MNIKLDEYLTAKYPKIFDRKHLRGKKYFGFEHGNGWFFLIDSLCKQIQNYIDRPPYVSTDSDLVVKLKHLWEYSIFGCTLQKFFNFLEPIDPYIINKCRAFFIPRTKFKHKNVPQVVALQVKEKLGGLRFYIVGGDDYIDTLIRFAENISYKICETCGAMNENINTTKGRVCTTCSDCAKDKTYMTPFLYMIQDLSIIGKR